MIDPEHLTFALRSPWSGGTTHLILSPQERIEKLAALTEPPPIRSHLEGVGLPARPLPQVEFDFDYAAAQVPPTTRAASTHPYARAGLPTTAPPSGRSTTG